MRHLLCMAVALGALSAPLALGEEKPSGVTQSQNAEKSMVTFRASDLIGMNVVNNQNEKLGSIKDLVIDVQKGGVSYAVLSHGGVLGIGDKLFAVPFGKFSLERDVDANKTHLVLDLTKERLQNAPGFADNAWPNFADQVWTQQLEQYYGTDRTATRPATQETQR